MPWWPCSVSTSTNSSTVSVSGFWRPVSTLASLTGLSSGRTTWDRVRVRMRSAAMAGSPRLTNLYDELQSYSISIEESSAADFESSRRTEPRNVESSARRRTGAPAGASGVASAGRFGCQVRRHGASAEGAPSGFGRQYRRVGVEQARLHHARIRTGATAFRKGTAAACSARRRSTLFVGTPDRIRTGATAVRGRPRDRRTTLAISECAGQGHNPRLATVGRFGLFLELVLPQCCPRALDRDPRSQ